MHRVVRRGLSSTSFSQRKVYLLGGNGFVGRHVQQAFTAHPNYILQPCCRHPQNFPPALSPSPNILPAIPFDITDPSTYFPLSPTDIVVNLIGILYEYPPKCTFESVQWRGVERVAKWVKEGGAKLVHVSAIGADATSDIPYARTKGLGEQAIWETCSKATVVRPSLVCGPEDDFFNRFAKLSLFLPFMPVFEGGTTRFQPVYVGDLAECIQRVITDENDAFAGKTIECGGPKVYTYRQLMEMILQLKHRYRPILSLPYTVGYLQGWVLEKLPVNIFTVTQDQVRLLQYDNVVEEERGGNTRVISMHKGVGIQGKVVEEMAEAWM